MAGAGAGARARASRWAHNLGCSKAEESASILCLILFQGTDFKFECFSCLVQLFYFFLKIELQFFLLSFKILVKINQITFLKNECLTSG